MPQGRKGIFDSTSQPVLCTDLRDGEEDHSAQIGFARRLFLRHHPLGVLHRAVREPGAQAHWGDMMEAQSLTCVCTSVQSLVLEWMPGGPQRPLIGW